MAHFGFIEKLFLIQERSLRVVVFLALGALCTAASVGVNFINILQSVFPNADLKIGKKDLTIFLRFWDLRT